MPTWIVTGGSGFLGSHLLAELVANRRDVTILAIGRTCPARWDRASFREIDLADRPAIESLLRTVRPDRLFHLAGKTPPGSSEEFDRVNFGLTVTLLGAVALSGVRCRFVLGGSAAELGPVPVEDLPVAEDYRCRPLDPYGMSKWRTTVATLGFSGAIEVVVARVFNPIGPGLPESQALGRYSRLLAEGTAPLRLKVGALDTRRDFIDVRDVASGLLAIADRGRSGQVYHLGTGQSHAVGEGLDRLIALSGREVLIEVDPDLARNRGPADSRASIRKIAEEVGWAPRIAWEQSLDDLWRWALERYRAGLTDGQPLV